MTNTTNRAFGKLITKLIQKENLSREEARYGFEKILRNETTDLQQGGFLAALASKGETKEEIAGSWDAIYDNDTVKVNFGPNEILVENSGTGMDTFKTFNISTAASIVAASGGVKMARHGARAITSVCGTVDIAEKLGVDVDCNVDVVKKSIQLTGMGLFNGMSPEVHPMALGRILSQIYFGTTLNIAASLANPTLPRYAVRGVFSTNIINPVIHVMKEIGYKRAIVLHGTIVNSDQGMDEASVCGDTFCSELEFNGNIKEYSFSAVDFGLDIHDANLIKPLADIDCEAKRFLEIISGNKKGACLDAVLLNAGLIFYIAGKTPDIKSGVEMARLYIKNGNALSKLKEWVMAQNKNQEEGLKKFNMILENIK